MTAREPARIRGDAALGVALAALLSAIWCVRGWPMLAALHLPDTDDVMRLQQIRDWLAGQRFADLSQHRLGLPPGLPMHWSRLPDLVPGAIIAALAPLFGRHDAEIVAVILWPALLFAAALFLTVRIARAIGGDESARTAAIVAAIAYPATTLFMPGRIDHHGAQIVLLLILIHALLRPADVRSGVIAGLSACLAFAIGMETVPFLAVGGLVLWMRWLRDGPAETARLTAFGAALSLGLLIASVILRTDQWRYPACDGFTATAWCAAQIAALAPLVLALGGWRWRGWRPRLILSGIIGAATLAAIFAWSPDCFDPYDHIDPLLARLWLANVAEAQPLFGAAPAVSIGYAGLLLAGIAASGWRLARTRAEGWAVLLAFQLTALALTLFELRGAYAGALLAAPALAETIARARVRGILALLGAWLVSAGILYPLAADALAAPRRSTAPAANRAACDTPAAIARLAALPPGRVLAPVDVGAYAIAGTRDTLVAAPYHRNNAGNAAMYRFFLGSPDTAHRIARRWNARYVVVCATSFDEVGDDVANDRRRLIGLLHAGAAPTWLVPADNGRDPVIYRVGDTQ